MIKDLLDVSNIQSGQLKLNKEPIDIGGLLADTIGAFQMISKTHTIKRENNFEHLTVMADRQRIEQVLLNLLSNAIKYSPGENSVMVCSTEDAGEVIIRVMDFWNSGC